MKCGIKKPVGVSKETLARQPNQNQYWISYGGGVNSTALAILVTEGALPQYEPWRIVFADTLTERADTYAFIENHFTPWLAQRGKTLEIVSADEGVLERWERIQVTGSRLIRACTVESKIKPVNRYIAAHGGGEQLIGIDADESHRIPDRIRPLVDLNYGREECEQIIKNAGLPSPGKSGCWCCPFMRVGEVIKLAKTEPCKFERIARLEKLATAKHGPQPDGSPRNQWHDKSTDYWRERAGQGDFFYDGERLKAPPCECFDGDY